jgi:hypothetical protein
MATPLRKAVSMSAANSRLDEETSGVTADT